MSQPSLLDQMSPRFSGACFDPAFDQARLTKQIGRVYDVLSRGQWMTLRELASATGDPESSVSAQVRNLKKIRFGAHQIEKRARGDRSNGLWEYRMVGE